MERMHRLLKESTRRVLPLTQILLTMLKIQEKESNRGIMQDNLHASKSHLVKSCTTGELKKKLGDAGFSPVSARTRLLKEYSRFPLAYAVEEARQVPAYQVVNSFIRGSKEE